MYNRICIFDKKHITIDDKGILHLECGKDFEKDMKDMLGIDVHDQKILRHVYFSTCSGKVSFTVPNKILKK